jgi:protein-tyrosine kinase
MSRIEEALRRARNSPEEATQPDAPARPLLAPDALQRPGLSPEAPVRPVRPVMRPQPPEDDLGNDSPWSFDDRPVDRQAPPPAGPRPAPRPGPNASGAPQYDPSAAPDPIHDGHMAVFSGFDHAIAERVVLSKEMPPVSVEQYRRLAATLHHTQVDRGIKLVMLTSAVTGEGKSLTATNLALTLSQSYGRRVLLIDADLRRPSIHAMFQMHNVTGLSEALKARDERKLSIIEITDRLSVLTAGRPDPDPMSGLTSDRMRRILEEAAARFDWVIIDTPPVALLPDANLLAAMVDTAVLVVGATQTSFDLVQRAVESVGRDKIIGVVLNRAENAGFDDAHYLAYYDGGDGRSR